MFSILGVTCLPLIGPAVGIVLGVVALRKVRGLNHAGGPKAMSIIAVVLGALGLLATAAAIWLGTLPALVGARDSAQRQIAMSNVEQLVGALRAYETANGAMPSADDWQVELIAAGSPAELFEPAYARPGVPSFFFVPPGTIDGDANAPTNILIYEQPRLNEEGTIAAFTDGGVFFMDNMELIDRIDNLRTPSGEPFAPHQAYPVP